MQRRGGLIQITVNGVVHDAKGNFTVNYGAPKREIIKGADRIHGYKEEPQAGMIKGEFTDRGDLSVVDLINITNGTVSLLVGNGKAVQMSGAVYTGDGEMQTEEGNVSVEFQGKCVEVPA